MRESKNKKALDQVVEGIKREVQDRVFDHQLVHVRDALMRIARATFTPLANLLRDDPNACRRIASRWADSLKAKTGPLHELFELCEIPSETRIQVELDLTETLLQVLTEIAHPEAKAA